MTNHLMQLYMMLYALQKLKKRKKKIFQVKKLYCLDFEHGGTRNRKYNNDLIKTLT